MKMPKMQVEVSLNDEDRQLIKDHIISIAEDRESRDAIAARGRDAKKTLRERFDEFAAGVSDEQLLAIAMMALMRTEGTLFNERATQWMHSAVTDIEGIARALCREHPFAMYMRGDG